MTQTKMILKHMAEGRRITPGEALSEYGCMRLAARIADIRRMGLRISSRNVTKLNRFGKKVSFKEYWLEET